MYNIHNLSISRLTFHERCPLQKELFTNHILYTIFMHVCVFIKFINLSITNILLRSSPKFLKINQALFPLFHNKWLNWNKTVSKNKWLISISNISFLILLLINIILFDLFIFFNIYEIINRITHCGTTDKIYYITL